MALTRAQQIALGRVRAGREEFAGRRETLQRGRGREEGGIGLPARTRQITMPGVSKLSIDPAQIKLQEEIAEANARATALFEGQTGAFQASERGTILAGSELQQRRGATGGTIASSAIARTAAITPAAIAGGPQPARKITAPTEAELQEEVELELTKTKPSRTVTLSARTERGN